jgi:hypothetical protein
MPTLLNTVHFDQMVLLMARQEAGPRMRWLKILKGELENNSRKLWNLVRKTGIVTA